MKWASAASLAAFAPAALAKSVHNVYPVNFDIRSPNKDLSSHGNSFNGHGGLITDTVIEEVIILWVNPGNGAATTTINANAGAGVTATAVQNGQTASAVAPPGAAQTHNVTVGGTSLAYSPDTIEAAVGDTVIFTFLSQNHTVTQSAFATPCEKLDGGMDSGFQPNPNNTVNPPPKVAMQVMSSGPLCKFKTLSPERPPYLLCEQCG
jgi:plastocyanin